MWRVSNLAESQPAALSVAEDASRPSHLRRLWSIVGAVAGRAFRHGSTNDATRFAYNAFLATVPFLVMLVVAISKVAGQDALDRARAQFDAAVPEELRQILFDQAFNQASRNADGATLALALSIPAALWITANAVSALMDGLNAAHGLPGLPWVRGKVVSMTLSVVGVVLVLVTTAALVGGPDLVNGFIDLFGGSSSFKLSRTLTYAIALAALALFTLILYRFGPTRRALRIRHLWPGVFFGLLAWMLTTQSFGYYVQRFETYNVVYGTLGFVVVYLIFLYLSGLVLLLGAELNAVLHDRRTARRGIPVID